MGFFVLCVLRLTPCASRVTVLMGWAFCFSPLTPHALRFTIYDKKAEGG